MFSASSLKFLLLAALALPVIASGQTAAAPNETVAPIDRQALVTRHNITWNDAAGRIALGNGEFCFGTDGTGLQTFAGNSIAHWGWHSFPLPDGCTPDLVPATGAFEHRTTDGKMKGAINTWMFDNPHMMNLGRLRLMRAGGRSLAPGDITGLHRTLDLWTGVQTSSYQIDGRNVTVETCVHPKLDMVAVRIVSPLVESGELEVALDFGYPTVNNAAWVGDFNRSEGHSTEVISSSPGRMDYKRTVDATGYRVALEVADGGVIRMPVTVRGGQKLAIRKAEYGTGDQWAEVTTKISAAVKNDKIAQAVDFTAMGVDPAPGKAKRLRVTYALDGLETNAEIPDNQIFHIPADDCANAYLVSARGHKTWRLPAHFPLSRFPHDCRFSSKRVMCVPRAGRVFGSTAGRLIYLAARIRAGRNWSGASCFRSTRWPRNRPALGHRLRPACWAWTTGAASFTWKWSGGTWRITPCGIAGRWQTRRWTATSGSFQRRVSWQPS